MVPPTNIFYLLHFIYFVLQNKMALELPNKSATEDDVRPLLKTITSSTPSLQADHNEENEEFSSLPAQQEAISISEEWIAQVKVSYATQPSQRE
jgi:hypothetical protein